MPVPLKLIVAEAPLAEGVRALTGGAVRLRGYGAAGLSLADIGLVSHDTEATCPVKR